MLLSMRVPASSTDSERVRLWQVWEKGFQILQGSFIETVQTPHSLMYTFYGVAKLCLANAGLQGLFISCSDASTDFVVIRRLTISMIKSMLIELRVSRDNFEMGGLQSIFLQASANSLNLNSIARLYRSSAFSEERLGILALKYEPQISCSYQREWYNPHQNISCVSS